MGKSEQNRVNLKMGIDLRKQGRTRTRHFRKTTTNNLYHGLLIKLYSFLARRTDSKFNQIVHKRLNGSGTTRYPMSLSRLVKVANTDAKRSKILVLVGNVLNDERMLTVPKMTVCAMRFSDAARQRIVANGGKCMTFDQLAKVAPKGENTLLLRGGRRREALRHFGSQNIDGAKPYCKGSHEESNKIKG